MSAGLEGRVFVVTGAASGIGAATARRLARAGARVTLADRDEGGVATVAEELARAGLRAHSERLEVAARDSWSQLVGTVVEREHRLDGLVNAAGIVRDRTLLRMSDEEWRDVLDVHLTGTWLGCQIAIPALREQGDGRIVNVSSSGRHGSFGQANYAAAKAGIVALTTTVALEHARHGIRCNCVAPGAVDTPMIAGVPEEVRARWIERIALGRFGRPEEIAAAVAFLLSDDSSYITGQVLDVNGLEDHP